MADDNSDRDQDGSNEPGEAPPRRGRGFAGMDAERQRQISAEGGRAAHRKGTAHEFDSEEAREAGRKGGQASGGSRRRRSGQHNTLGGGVERGESDNDNENDDSRDARRGAGGDEPGDQDARS